MSRTTGFVLAGLLVLSLFIIAACSLGTQDVEMRSGVSLQIGDGGLSRLLTVAEYDVTSLDIAILYEEDTVCEFTWTPNGEWSRIFIPLLHGGRFDIVVTHNGVKDGEFFSATESAKFRYDFGIITVIKIIPGMVGVIDVDPGEVEPCDDFIALWYGEVLLPDFEDEEFYTADMNFTVLDSVDIEMMARLSETGEIVEDFSMKGTWACADEYITGVWTDAWSEDLKDWIPIPWGDPIHWSATYSVDGDTMSLNVDFEGNEPPVPMLTWDFTR
jgi:hypothetical protein